MLQDYRVYLVNLRNNLIQCGVEYPINSMESYNDIFYEADKLRQVLEYYSIMNISGADGSIPEYPIPLTGYYKEKMRQVFYEEFQEFLKDYMGISKLAYLSGSTTTLVSQERPLEIFGEDDEIDLFEDEEPKINVVNYSEPVVESQEIYDAVPIEDSVMEVTTGADTFRRMLQEPPKVNYTEDVHGIFLDDLELEDMSEEEDEVERHGTFLDDSKESFSLGEFSLKSTCKPVQNSVYCNVEGGAVYPIEDDANIHGIFLDDIEDSSESEEDVQYDENGFIIEDEPEDYSYDEDVEDAESEWVDEDDGIQYDENGFIIEDESEDSYYEDEDEDEDSWVDEYDGVQYDENGFEIEDEPEDSYYDDEDEDIQYDENGFIVEDESEFSYYEEDSVCNNTPSTSHISQGTSISSKPNEDMADFLQNATNSLLTKGKRFILKEQRKFRSRE